MQAVLWGSQVAGFFTHRKSATTKNQPVKKPATWLPQAIRFALREAHLAPARRDFLAMTLSHAHQ